MYSFPLERPKNNEHNNLLIMKKLSQKQQIRNYLEAGGKITALAALNFWDCLNLKGRIYDIREEYHDEWLAKKPFQYHTSDKRFPKLQIIETDMVKTNSGKYIAEYSLERVD